MELVVAGDLLGHGSAAEVFEDDEVANEVEEPPLVENSLDHDVEFREMCRGKCLASNRAPGLEPLPPRPERSDACLDPSEISSVSL